MHLSYYDSAEDCILSKDRAAQEIQRHGNDPQEFFQEQGEHETYSAQMVLRWLGY